MLNKPKAFIFAGANASGKSTLITHLLQENIIYGTYVNPEIIVSLYNGKKCFINNEFQRDVTWHLNLLEGTDIDEELSDEIAMMHVQFCESIKNSVITFSNTLEKTYDEKNKILATKR